MIVRTEQYVGYRLALKRNDEKYQVAIFDASNRLIASTGTHAEAKSAIGEARRYVDALRTA
jgi:hypothetical protein